MTPQEAAKNDFESSRKKFKETAQRMSESLEKWVIGQGGSFDDEGNIINLSPQNEKLFEWKNKQLSDLLHFDKSTEAYIKALRQSLAEVTQANTLIKAGKSDDDMTFINDTQVRKYAHFYFDWRIGKTTTKQEFRRACVQTVKWIDEAEKRLLITEDMKAGYFDKRKIAAQLLKDETLIKQYFDNRTKQFLHDSGTVPQPITPTS